MKRKKLIFLLAFVVALTGALSTKAFAKREPAAWTPDVMCTLRTEPLKCTVEGTTICTVAGFTYYSDMNCTLVINYNPNGN
jgi:hypothetical protein